MRDRGHRHGVGPHRGPEGAVAGDVERGDADEVVMVHQGEHAGRVVRVRQAEAVAHFVVDVRLLQSGREREECVKRAKRHPEPAAGGRVRRERCRGGDRAGRVLVAEGAEIERHRVGVAPSSKGLLRHVFEGGSLSLGKGEGEREFRVPSSERRLGRGWALRGGFGGGMGGLINDNSH